MTKQYQVPLTGSVERINRKIREFLFCFFFCSFCFFPDEFKQESGKIIHSLQ